VRVYQFRHIRLGDGPTIAEGLLPSYRPEPPSSRGLGRRPLTAETGVRIPVAVPPRRPATGAPAEHSSSFGPEPDAHADELKVIPGRLSLPVLCAFAALAVALTAYAASLATGVGAGTPQDVLYFALMGGACALCAWRACLGGDRLVWLLLAAALLSWIAGDVLWLILGKPDLSIADAGFLGFYAFALPALVVLLRRRATGALATLWADGWVAALTVAAVAACFFVEPVIEGVAGESLMSVLVNLAYPIADSTLLAFVVGAAVAARGAMRGSWLALSAALAVNSVTDGIYLNLSWTGANVDGTLIEAGWPAAALGLSWASWLSLGESAERRPIADRAPIVWPVIWGCGSLSIVAVLAMADDAHPLAIPVALAGVLSVFGRLMLTDAQNRRLVRAASRQALSDPITGLGNHRALTRDLESTLASTPAERRVLLAIFDLNGFKDYNDLFGHPAGDALLERLGRSLAAGLTDGARAYRMGGDEFCVLAVVEAGAGQDLLLARAERALSEQGDGFTVSAAAGHVLARPGEMTASAAMGIADKRMYATKRRVRTSSLHQATDVLATLAAERDPLLGRSGDRVARLAETTARELGLEDELVAQVRHAALLHDVGKLAIPDAILDKPAPLDHAELEFVCTHPLVGERIVSAAPSLLPIGRLIRSSHERYDGGGYPDGLAGEDIPLGSRIVFVCDAFGAMTSERPYRSALSEQEALRELARNAGTQFDAAVVAAFTAVAHRLDSSGALAA
jgi:two-component system, cell cycle response regulator